MINDYHGIRIKDEMAAMPDQMVHELGRAVELQMLEAGIKPHSIAMFYESVYRQRPKVHGIDITDNTGARDSIG